MLYADRNLLTGEGNLRLLRASSQEYSP